MLLIPVGFVSDHVEILYDIDVLFRDYGKARGVTVRRSESLNDSPEFAAALASLVTARIEQVSGVRLSGAAESDCVVNRYLARCSVAPGLVRATPRAELHCHSVTTLGFKPQDSLI